MKPPVPTKRVTDVLTEVKSRNALMSANGMYL